VTEELIRSLRETVERQRQELELHQSELAQTNAGLLALHAEVERQRQRLAFLDEVSRTVSSSLRGHEVVKALVRLIRRDSVAASVAVWVRSPAGTLRREPADGTPDAEVERALELGQPVRRPRRLLIPLTVGPSMLGLLEVGREDSDFAEEDLSFFTAVADRSAVALRNASEYERERELAERLQRAMLPSLSVPGPLRLCARYRPAATGVHVGGDWFDAFSRRDGTITLTVGDVTGHGLDAAVLMGKLQNALRAYAIEGHGPAATLKLANELVRGWESPLFATAVVADLEPASGKLSWASAGHLPILASDGDGECAFLERPAAPLLGFPFAFRIQEYEASVPPGGSLVLYTDGLVERRGELIDAGLERLAKAVRASAALATEDAGDLILSHMLGADDHDDDVCLLLCRLGCR
jgi:serine phosphatase RsbU (regulator of sigma subunit)